MGMNIKNPRVHALAREAARRTGKSQSSVVEEALEKLLADYAADDASRADQRQARLDTIIADFRRVRVDTGPVDEDAASNHDWLYDNETGLPR